MNKFVARLGAHKAVNIILIIGYFLLVVLPHERFGRWINRFFLSKNGSLVLTRAEYNQLVAAVAGSVFILISIGLFYQLRKNDQWKKVIFYLLASTAFAVVLIKTLFVINIEMVHFPQYAMFAIIIFPLTMRYHSTLIWATIAGAIDEAYQYFYLAPEATGYYDFNDVVTNLIGASFGLIVLKAFDVKEREGIIPFFKRSEVIGVLALTGILALLYLLGIWSFYPTADVPYPLFQKPLTTFWTTVPPQVTFHVLRPLEALVVIPGLIFFYRWLR